MRTSRPTNLKGDRPSHLNLLGYFRSQCLLPLSCRCAPSQCCRCGSARSAPTPRRKAHVPRHHCARERVLHTLKAVSGAQQPLYPRRSRRAKMLPREEKLPCTTSRTVPWDLSALVDRIVWEADMTEAIRRRLISMTWRYLTQGMAKSMSEISLPRPKLILSSGTWCIIRVTSSSLRPTFSTA